MTIVWRNTAWNTATCDQTNWSCEPDDQPVMQLDAATCDGCQILDPIGGVSYFGAIDVNVTAANDDATITATVTDLPSNTTATVSGAISTDHEVGLQAQCRLVDRASYQQALQTQIESGFGLPPQLYVEWLQPCGATRSPDQVVLVFPQVTTYRGATTFPFAASSSDPNDRDLSTLALDVTPQAWGWVQAALDSSDFGDLASSDFAAYPQLGDVGRIGIATRLSTGIAATTSVAIPRLCTGAQCRDENAIAGAR